MQQLSPTRLPSYRREAEAEGEGREVRLISCQQSTIKTEVRGITATWVILSPNMRLALLHVASTSAESGEKALSLLKVLGL